MPRVLAYTPSWLSRPSPGFTLFQGAGDKQHEPLPAPLKTIAHRGTEIFVAVGRELRWADLALLNDSAQDGQAYRVLAVKVPADIRQLSVAPNGAYMAILTAHTCHFAMLPPSTLLHSGDATPLRLRTFQVGPVAHVVEQAPLVAALWHPLSPSGACLVTVTRDACVRLWECDSANRSTFSDPALAIDLKKLANANSSLDDWGAGRYGVKSGFSPDDVEMEVATACFGGTAAEEEHGWASMTLWVAMSEGDVYALCPLLPARWAAPSTLLPSLTTSVVAKTAAIRYEQDATETERRISEQQTRWLRAIDSQEPLFHSAGEDDTLEIYQRPETPSVVPRLQGPYELSPAPDFGEITDIHVIAPKLDTAALFGEDDDVPDTDGCSLGIVCLATSTSRVHICLDLEGVEAEWLPTKRSRAYALDDADAERELLLFETLDMSHSDGTPTPSRPTFTPSPASRYDLFVTQPTGVYALSTLPWVRQLEDELAADTSQGVHFRMQNLLDSPTAHSAVDHPLHIPPDPIHASASVIATLSPTLGFLLLTSHAHIPHAATLSLPQTPNPHAYAPDTATTPPAPTSPRQTYQPAEPFFAPPLHLTPSAPYPPQPRQTAASPATLHLLTHAHRAIAHTTHALARAAAALFRQCERMRAELRAQVSRVGDIATVVQSVVVGEHGAACSRERLGAVVRGNHELGGRVAALRRKVASLGGAASKREQGFAREVDALARSLLPAAAAGQAPTSPAALVRAPNRAADVPDEPKGGGSQGLAGRFEDICHLRDGLLRRVERLDGRRGVGAAPEGEGGAFQRRRVAEVMGMLEREGALVEGLAGRVAGLGG